MSEKAKGKAKEVFGAMTDDEAKKEEGEAQQRKAEAEAEATQEEKTRQEKANARQAERKRDQEKGTGGLLGGVSDSLTGRNDKR
jgi:uncharacterized protein YjbJ (UPF0337 family)